MSAPAVNGARLMRGKYEQFTAEDMRAVLSSAEALEDYWEVQSDVIHHDKIPVRASTSSWMRNGREALEFNIKHNMKRIDIARRTRGRCDYSTHKLPVLQRPEWCR